jgi:mannosyl-3-phosphoglycerate phosphatase
VSERRPELLVVSDLDGCLLDEQSYSFEEAREALDALRAHRVPLVLATSKTRAELRPLQRQLDLPHPAIVENGGALVIPKGQLKVAPGASLVRGFQVVALGAPRAELVAALRAIAAESGLVLRGFAAMGARELRQLTGLKAEAARLALEREFDEPFVVEGGDAPDAARLARAAEARGLRVTRGGRFFHLHGHTDKGRALDRLLELYAAEGRHFQCLALGDSANDLELLERAERAVIVPRPDGAPDPLLRARLPGAELAPAPGPRGWNAAVLKALASGGSGARRAADRPAAGKAST